MVDLSLPPFGRFGWVDVALIVWFAATVVSVGYVGYAAIAKTSDVKALRWEWVLVTLYLGPVGFVLYVLWRSFAGGMQTVMSVAAAVVGVGVAIALVRRDRDTEPSDGASAGPPSRRPWVSRRRWARRTISWAGGLMALVLLAAMVIAYVWQPEEEQDYVSGYLAQSDSEHVETSIARFHYVKAGEGPPVVLIPGGTLWLYSYRDIISALSTNFTVYAVDMPGQGYTENVQSDFGYDLESMSDALDAFMSAAGLNRASVVGHSWGGAIALYFAERHPQRVAKLGLLGSPGLDDRSTTLFEALEFPIVGEVFGKLMSRSSFEDGLRDMFVDQERLTEHDVDEYWAPLSRRENREAMWLQQRAFDYSLTERQLSDVDAPTLVLWGDQDEVVEPWQAHELGRQIRGATVAVLSGCGHMVHEDCTARAIRELRRFLSD